MAMSVAQLEARRDHLRAALGALGDLRPGTLVERHRKCGKPTCHCAVEGDPGHGPVWTLVFRQHGKSKTRVIPAAEVARTRAQIDEYRRLRALTAELVEVSEGLCHARLATGRDAEKAANKGASRKPSRRRSAARSSG